MRRITRFYYEDTRKHSSLATTEGGMTAGNAVLAEKLRNAKEIRRVRTAGAEGSF